MSTLGFGPAAERLAPGQRATGDLFRRVVAPLTDGELCFPDPFDLTASASLAANVEKDDDAVTAYDANRRRSRPRYRVLIEQVADGPDGLRRPVLDTVTDALALPALLDDVIDTLTPDGDNP